MRREKTVTKPIRALRMAKQGLFASKLKRPASPIPVYYQLQMLLKEEIENSRWMPGRRIPPERVLAESYDLSVGTVKKAILNLVNAGYLYRIQGKGTFVAGMKLQPESLRYYRFLKNFGDREDELQVKLLDLKTIKGYSAVNALLKLKPNQDLYQIKRIFLSGKRTVVYTVSYLPCKLFANLDSLPLTKFEKIPLYIALEEHYGLPTMSNRELFSAIPADGATAKIMKIRKGKPVAVIQMLSFTYKQTPYEYRKSYCLTDAKAIFREI